MRILILIASFIFAASTYAADGPVDAASIERANLAKIVSELDYLNRRLETHARQVVDSGRYRFDYQALAADIRAMRSGIVEYIERDLSLAREYPALRKEYVIDLGNLGKGVR